MELLSSSLKILKCTVCNAHSIEMPSIDSLQCNECKSKFQIIDFGVIDFLHTSHLNKPKNAIRSFWGDLSKQWYSEFDNNLDQLKMEVALRDLNDLFSKRRHLAVTEIILNLLNNKFILEIGSGGGGHSSLFKSHGANIVSMDITPERAISTAKKLSYVSEGSGLALIADGENIPFVDNTFDIIYSNGVLHHAENTEKCINEVYRVLKPGGKAIIMLYSKNSVYYWCNLFIQGIITGGIFKFSQAEWLGRITEGRPKFGVVKNPLTRVYTRKQMLDLFNKFKIISLRKHSFFFEQFWIVGYLFRIFNLMFRKPHPGGLVVYGKTPFFPETKLEHILSSKLGWAWNISAMKE